MTPTSPATNLKLRVALFLRKIASFERKQGNKANASAIDVLIRAVDKISTAPDEYRSEERKPVRRRQ